MKIDKKKMNRLWEDFRKEGWFSELPEEDQQHCVEMQYSIDNPFVDDATNALLNIAIGKANMQSDFMTFLKKKLPYVEQKGWNFKSEEIARASQPIRILKQRLYNQRMAFMPL